MDKIQEIFASRLKEIRKASHLSQGDVAKLADISQSNIARYETLKSEATITPLAKIAQALNVTSDYLLGMETQKQEVVPEFNQEQLQVVELIKKLNSKELEKVYNYLLGIIDARD